MHERTGGYIFMVFLCVLVCGYYYSFFFNRAYVQLDIEVSSKTDFKLYWAGENQLFSEKKQSTVRVVADQDHYEFFLTDIGKIAKLRIDPCEYVGEVRVKKLTVSQKGYELITVDFEELKPLHDVAEYSYDNKGLSVVSSGNDANFLFVPEIRKAPIDWGAELFRIALIVALLVTVVKVNSPLRKNFAWVPLLLALAFILVVTMAAISERNAHPDEYVHLDAVNYYQEHWLPPEIDDKLIEHTYSMYGMSRLNNGEIYYLLAGKIANVAEIFKISHLFSLRLFNVLLFSLILLYAFHCVPARLVAIPLLISPQIWYIFSYCDSDAFALFICFLAGCEVVRSGSYLNRLLTVSHPRRVTALILINALLLAMLFLLKKNYYPFIALFYLMVLWRIINSEEREVRGLFFKRLIITTLVAASFAGMRVAADYYVNGLDRQQKILTMQEKTAHRWYKPSTELHKKHISLYMKARGRTLDKVVKQDRWFGKTFYSAFGLYGYFTIGASEGYYNIVKWAASALLCYLFFLLFLKGGLENSAIGIVAAGLSVALIGVSLYHSWTMDFQAQGRYLFPILPMFGIVLARARDAFNSRIFILGVSQLYLLALYSFIFIALMSIPRPA